MIKCKECGEEFSYGRKINCCKSVYFGKIFSSSKNDHNWNCRLNNIKLYTAELNTNKTFEIRFVNDDEPAHYNWNCENDDRFTCQKNMEMKDQSILYE
ncbi:MAG: hypothetical protein ACFFDF_17680 [Candidatus Odinarchaeota archaeon]